MDTIEVPGALAGLAKIVVGSEWPKVKEGLLWELGQLDQEAARLLAEILEALRRVIPGAAASATGPAGDAMTDLLDRLSAVIPDLVETANALGDSAKSTAAEIQYGKLMIIGVMIWLAAELAALLPWSWVPGVAALIEAVEAAAAVVARTLLGRILRSVAARASFSRALQAAGAASASRIAQLLERLGVDKGVARSAGELGGRMVNGALAGTAFNVGLDVGIQAGQMAAGVRQSWNTQATAFGALTGVAGGVLGAGLIHGVQSAVGRLGEKSGARRADAEGLKGPERVIRVAEVRAEMTSWVTPPAVTRPAWKTENFTEWKSAAGLRSLPARAAVGGAAGLGATVIGNAASGYNGGLGLGFISGAVGVMAERPHIHVPHIDIPHGEGGGGFSELDLKTGDTKEKPEAPGAGLTVPGTGAGSAGTGTTGSAGTGSGVSSGASRFASSGVPVNADVPSGLAGQAGRRRRRRGRWRRAGRVRSPLPGPGLGPGLGPGMSRRPGRLGPNRDRREPGRPRPGRSRRVARPCPVDCPVSTPCCAANIPGRSPPLSLLVPRLVPVVPLPVSLPVPVPLPVSRAPVLLVLFRLRCGPRRVWGPLVRSLGPRAGVRAGRRCPAWSVPRGPASRGPASGVFPALIRRVPAGCPPWRPGRAGPWRAGHSRRLPVPLFPPVPLVPLFLLVSLLPGVARTGRR
ncbi:hypothetical protein OG819_50150 [Streptomyces sp. NBC_01549]|uniref:WXG100-like domain-containing protein n=1 Tax=Streptomyces sp. NBC_01549 TaxID=2975874 RepID=UPI00225834D5|nr:hypothetical protein [Streptomyces sp. NBC_01549]MCX4597452.1 hypothetical protein [Streptomyces sp. NBC_01549]